MEMLQSSLVQKITRSLLEATTTSSVASDRDRQTDSVAVSSVVQYTTMKPCRFADPKKNRICLWQCFNFQ
jgi:hypothetical protein